MTRQAVVPASFILNPAGNWIVAGAASHAAAGIAAKPRTRPKCHLQSANVFGKARTFETRATQTIMKL